MLTDISYLARIMNTLVVKLLKSSWWNSTFPPFYFPPLSFVSSLTFIFLNSLPLEVGSFKGPWSPKLTYTFLSIFLKVQNFMITLTVISAPSVLATRKNLPLKSTIYENDVENAPP